MLEFTIQKPPIRPSGASVFLRSKERNNTMGGAGHFKFEMNVADGFLAPRFNPSPVVFTHAEKTEKRFSERDAYNQAASVMLDRGQNPKVLLKNNNGTSTEVTMTLYAYSMLIECLLKRR